MTTLIHTTHLRPVIGASVVHADKLTELVVVRVVPNVLYVIDKTNTVVVCSPPSSLLFLLPYSRLSSPTSYISASSSLFISFFCTLSLSNSLESPLCSLQRFFLPELVALLVILSPRLLLSLLSLPLFVTDLSSSIKLLILIQQIWNFSADITSACMVRTKTKEGGRRCKIFVATSNCRIWCLYYPPPWLSSSPSSDDALSSQQLSKLEPDSKYVSFSPLLSWFFLLQSSVIGGVSFSLLHPSPFFHSLDLNLFFIPLFSYLFYLSLSLLLFCRRKVLKDGSSQEDPKRQKLGNPKNSKVSEDSNSKSLSTFDKNSLNVVIKNVAARNCVSTKVNKKRSEGRGGRYGGRMEVRK